MKIIAVLLNPTIDQIYEIENFFVGGTFKVNESIIYPVGKAISFSLGISELSDDGDLLKVIACIGKEDINLYARFLSERKIDFQFIEIQGKTRSNKTINDPIKNTTTHIREKGFKLHEKDIEILEDLIDINIEEGDIIVFSGSIPPNVKEDIYYDFINLCKSKDGITVLDTSTSALINGIKANPTIIKPNLLELSQILNKSELNNLDLSDYATACKILIKEARPLLNEDLKIILITLGENGAICLTKSEAFYGNVKIENVVDTVGSGDAFLAGFIFSFSSGKDNFESLKCAIASGAANTLIPGAGILKKEEVKELLKNVILEKLN
jgi:1-phosphofructokinase family hexose kinase